MPRYNPDLPVALRPVWRVRVIGRLFDQLTVNDLYYLQGGNATTIPTNAQIAAQALLNLTNGWSGAVSQDWTGQYLIVDNLASREEVPAKISAAALSGIVANDADRSIVCVRLIRSTLTQGQKGRGMIRLAGVAETDVLENDLTPGGLARMQGLIVALSATIQTANPTDGTMTPCLAKVIINPQNPGVPVVRAQNLTAWTVNVTTGSQVTRKANYGA